jgi:hypothetical protein
MRALNFDMPTLNGSVLIGAEAAAARAGALQQAPDALSLAPLTRPSHSPLSLAWLVNAASEVLVPRENRQGD